MALVIYSFAASTDLSTPMPLARQAAMADIEVDRVGDSILEVLVDAERLGGAAGGLRSRTLGVGAVNADQPEKIRGFILERCQDWQISMEGKVTVYFN